MSTRRTFVSVEEFLAQKKAESLKSRFDRMTPDERADFADRFLALALDDECAFCGKPATCVGSYEGQEESPACDDCCGHGNEDGRCIPLPEGAA